MGIAVATVKAVAAKTAVIELRERDVKALAEKRVDATVELALLRRENADLKRKNRELKVYNQFLLRRLNGN